MARKRVHVIVEGRVQGVFFRAHTREEADRLGLDGWVRNRPEGTVEAVVEGEAEVVDRMLDWLREGPPMSHVSRLLVTEEEPAGDGNGFEIHY